MAAINITISPAHELVGVPIAVEVFDADLERQWQGAIVLGGSRLVEGLRPGKYWVEASPPSGRTVAKVCKLTKKGETKEVSLNVEPLEQKEGLERAGIARPRLASDVPRDQTPSPLIWLRLWGCGDDGRWTVRPWPIQVPRREPGIVHYEFHFRTQRRFGQYFLQVGGPNLPWRLIALPADDIRVSVVRDLGPDPWTDEVHNSLEVAVASLDTAADALLGYLARGNINRVKCVGQALLAEELLEGRSPAPTSAAVAGYFLLAIWDSDRLENLWTSAMVDRTKWLPDTPVIDAWALMRRRDPDFQRARRRLLEAAARGVPVYTRGLRLLIDGLAMFDQDPIYAGPDVRAALQRVRRVAANADWRASTTTFTGQDPTTPGPTKGDRPDDPKHLVFLDTVDHEALTWKLSEGGPVSAQLDMVSEPHLMAFGPTVGGPDVPQLDMASEPHLMAFGPTVGGLDVPQLDRFARGELGEDPLDPDPVEALWSKSSTGDTGQAQAEARTASWLSAEEARVKSSPPWGAPEPQAEERLVARLLRAADLQTDGERLGMASPVTLKLDIDDPPRLYGVALERVMGRTDSLSACFLERGLAAGRAVARLSLRDDRGRTIAYGTGFLVSPRLLLTCRHLLPGAAEANNAVVDFGYYDGFDGRLLPRQSLSLDPSAFFASDTDLDITLVAVAGGPTVGYQYGWHQLGDQDGKAIVGEPLSFVHHPDGAPQQVSLRGARILGIVESFFHYQSGAAAPSVGAPVFNDQWEVVGVHHAGIAQRDTAGQLVATDGTSWTPGLGLHRLRWAGHEGIRTRSIVHALKRLELAEAQAVLRDELLYGNPPETSGAQILFAKPIGAAELPIGVPVRIARSPKVQPAGEPPRVPEPAL